MPLDLALAKHTLQVLANLGDNAIPLKTLAAEVEILHARSVTIQDVESTLTELRDREFVATRKDGWTRNLYAITDAGRAALRGM